MANERDPRTDAETADAGTTAEDFTDDEARTTVANAAVRAGGGTASPAAPQAPPAAASSDDAPPHGDGPAPAANTDEPPPPAPIPRAISTGRLVALLVALFFAFSLGARIGPTLGADLLAVGSQIFGGHDAHDHAGGPQYFTCGMHPWVVLPRPGTCPICGMDLVPLDPAKFSGEVTIDPVVSQNIGVRVEKVGEGTASGSIRTVGTVTYDETLLGDVNVKVPGWIEKLYVDSLGAPVKRGQPLFALYSPEVYAAQAEYLLAFKASQRAAAGGNSAVSGLAGELLDPARTKLELFDVGAAQIRALEARGEPLKTITVSSPQAGVVVEKKAFEGMQVTPGMTAYRIADLSRVWVMATLYEYQGRQIRLGQAATMTLTYLPGETFAGKAVYIYPYLDERTRQLNVRLEFDNPDQKLKPGMYATVVFEGTQTESRVVVSRSAVIDTGERQVAFVAKGEGRFEPRTVHMGAETDDGKVEILDGLAAGEQVVVSGQFLIDSEARMREALARMIRGTPVAEATRPAAPAVQSSQVALPEAANETLGKALDAYLDVGESLATGAGSDTGVAARKIVAAIDALMAMEVPGHPHFWHEQPAAMGLKTQAEKLAAAENVAAARATYAALSVELSQLLHSIGVPKSYGKELEDAHCPMYPAGSKEGSVWVQPKGSIRNPYFGQAMLTCSDWQRPFEVAP